MKLFDINPYVRFARVQQSRMPHFNSVAPDHRIFYCSSGDVTITVGNSTYHLKQGSLIFWRAGMIYKVEAESTVYALHGCNFDFFISDKHPKSPVSYLKEREFDKNLLIEGSLPEKLPFLPDCLFLENFPYKEKFEEIIREYTQKEIFYEERCSSILKDIIICAVRMYNTGENHAQKNKTDRILMYIREHYSENVTNTQIAKLFSYHPNYINSLIKNRTGKSLHKYILEYRIHTAIAYLQSGDFSITEIAALVGFDDVKHFSKCFKSITGNTPSSYKLRE